MKDPIPRFIAFATGCSFSIALAAVFKFVADGKPAGTVILPLLCACATAALAVVIITSKE